MSLVEKLGTDSETSLPRSNGELVFEEPWESRAFGMAAALADLGIFDWSDFQQSLITSIAKCEPGQDGLPSYRYYERWFAALEALVVERGLISTAELDTLVTDFCKRPHGHDHDHADGHHH
ncbi:nitrile hydratase accessory protein [Hoeflea sp. TYP-13]|uniref:nitrile hydratase accessory protein n=1 Tax=Hoeflea sp. TYP-13 TaxID=3230023 RepID=UPI0034C5B493